MEIVFVEGAIQFSSSNMALQSFENENRDLRFESLSGNFLFNLLDSSTHAEACLDCETPTGGRSFRLDADEERLTLLTKKTLVFLLCTKNFSTAGPKKPEPPPL